jgi:predicted regulator of Ras-like GTPase activity (Roadblock/LC7/MglB family)
MLRYFKSLYSWLTNDTETTSVPAERAPDAAGYPDSGASQARAAGPIASSVPAQGGPPPAAAPDASPNGIIMVPVSAVVPEVAAELQQRLAPHDQRQLLMPLRRVVPQLASGEISFSIDELRPLNKEVLGNIFLPGTCPIRIPLGEVLKQIKPDQYRRRAHQKAIIIPEEVTGPFDKSGGKYILAKPVGKPAAPAPAAKPAPAPPPTAPAPAAAPAIPGPAMAPTPGPAGSPVPPTRAPIPTPAAPASRPSSSFSAPIAGTSLPAPSALRPTARPTQAPIPAQPTAPNSRINWPTRPATLPTPTAPGSTLPPPGAVSAPTSLPTPPSTQVAPSAPKPAVPSLPVPSMPAADETAAAANGQVLRIPLVHISQDWSAGVRQELAKLPLNEALLAVPISLLEQALKSGQVQFAWRRLSAWIEPAVPPGMLTIGAETLLELPLKIVAPLFLARRHPTATQRKVSLAEDIPDVFGKTGLQAWGLVTPPGAGAPKAAAPAPAAAPPPGSPTQGAPAAAPAPAKPSEPAFELNAVIGPPGQRFSARDIIANTSKLPGAVGALLAMSDGLMVTSALPAHVKGEVVAAFLPQIFGRMAQYSRELNMGGLRSISFAVEGGNWQLVKEPTVYLAVLTRLDKVIPLNHLAAIAAELNKQQQ